MPAELTKGPASYFPSIEKRYGRSIGEWQQLVRDQLPAKHMDMVSMLKSEHEMGYGHANAIVAHVLSAAKDKPTSVVKKKGAALDPHWSRTRFADAELETAVALTQTISEYCPETQIGALSFPEVENFLA